MTRLLCDGNAKPPVSRPVYAVAQQFPDCGKDLHTQLQHIEFKEKKGRSEGRPKFYREEMSKNEENTIRLDNQTVLHCNIFPNAPAYKGK